MSGVHQILLGGSQAPAVDPFFYSVTSLLHGDGTNGGQNNTFLDSSTNNFTITRNGNTTQGSFSPFSQTGWSNYFDGSGDFLSLPANTSSAFDFTSTKTLTFECWAYFTGFPDNATVFDIAESVPFRIVCNTGGITWQATSAGTTIAFASVSIPLNIWNHIACVRDVDAISIYLNGTRVASATYSPSWVASGATAYVGCNRGNTWFVQGYLSNVRLVKGTAVYSGATLTVPTAPLTAISGTSLLTCQANRFRDASTNNFAITRNGDVSVQPFSPFNPTTPYSTSSIGGSGYFDGAGDFLQVADAAPMELGSGNWTIEMWVNTLNNTQYSALFTRDDGGTTAGSYVILLNTTSANGIVTFWSADVNSFTAAVLSSGTTSCRDGAWHHIAVVRNGNTLTMYIDGTSTSTASFSGSFGNTAQPLKIGSETGYSRDYTGYISNVRLVVGTAVYTANFTPPTSPLTAITNTQLLANFTNGAIFDNAAVTDYETVGNAQISTSVKKYGTGSIAFDGTGDYLVTDAPSTQLMTFGTGDFTVEFWLYVAVFPSAGDYKIIYDSRPTSTNGLYPTITLKGSTLVYFTNSADRITSGSISATTWYHVALCRAASQTKLFINGTQVGSTYADTNSYINGASRPLIGDSGSAPSGANGLNGYIDDLRISKGIGRYAYNFTPPTMELPNIGGTVTLTADPYFDYTTLLLPGNGTNGAQNNTFLDSSTNNFTITRNGNTTQGTFSPFSQTGWGNYFDGSSDYIQTPSNAALAFGSGDFTIEMWIYPTAKSRSFPAIYSNNVTFGTNWISINYDHDSYPKKVVAYIVNSSTSPLLVSASQFEHNSWYHVAMTRSGSTFRLFVNGTLQATGTFAGSADGGSSHQARIGSGPTLSSDEYTGYISNARIVKGTAVYTADFTPSTTPLTAISGTSLLTCQNNRFIDNSTNAFAITRNGNVSVQAFSPFNPTAAWSASTNGGSGYFDGSGDFLTAPSNAAFGYGTGDFTIEMWIYPTVISGSTPNIFDQRTAQPQVAPTIYINVGQLIYYTNGLNRITGATLVAGQWYHIAVCRASGSTRMFLNGVQTGSTYADANNYINSPVSIFTQGVAGAVYQEGYCGDVRVVKGTALYTTTFTPPTAPLTAISGTSLLLNYTNAGIYDATSKNDLETVGNAQISTTQSKFGGSSMYFDGTDDRLLAPTSPNLTFGTGDFTIEAWVNRSTSGSVIHFIDFRGSNNAGSNPVFYWQTNNFIYYTNENASGDNQIQTSNAITSSSGWVHLAIVRFGTTLTVYVNGLASGSVTYSTNVLGGNPVTIANRFNNSGAYTGYIDDLRITKGIARYTSNFTPPTTAFLTL